MNSSYLWITKYQNLLKKNYFLNFNEQADTGKIFLKQKIKGSNYKSTKNVAELISCGDKASSKYLVYLDGCRGVDS